MFPPSGSKRLCFAALSAISLAAIAISFAQAYNVSIAAEALIKAYYENEVAANSKYAGVNVSVGGIVHRVGQDDLGNPYVILNGATSQTTSASAGHLRCNFSDTYSAQVAKLHPNALIAIHGTIVGAKSQGREIILKNCSL